MGNIAEEISKPWSYTAAISCSRDESGERANVARLCLATIQNNNKCIKSSLMLCKCTAVGKKDDVAQVEKTPACWESRVSKKSLLQFRGCAIITWRRGGGGEGFEKWVKYPPKLGHTPPHIKQKLVSTPPHIMMILKLKAEPPRIGFKCKSTSYF